MLYAEHQFQHNFCIIQQILNIIQNHPRKPKNKSKFIALQQNLCQVCIPIFYLRQVWFYKGYHGWWQYDDRSSTEIEEAFKNKLPSLQIVIAGNLYEIDLVNMQQYQVNRASRKRDIKRDNRAVNKKGVAGMATGQTNQPSTTSTNNIEIHQQDTDQNLTDNNIASSSTVQSSPDMSRLMPIGEAAVDIRPSFGDSQDTDEEEMDTQEIESEDPPLARALSSNIDRNFSNNSDSVLMRSKTVT